MSNIEVAAAGRQRGRRHPIAVLFHVDHELYAWLNREAEAADVSKANYLRRVFRAHKHSLEEARRAGATPEVAA